jgi:hypothetical protein
MDTVAAAFQVRLLVEHSVPLATFACHSLEKTAVALGRDFVEQELDGWPHRSPDAKFGRGAAPERDRSFIDLNDRAFLRQKFRTGAVSWDSRGIPVSST